MDLMIHYGPKVFSYDETCWKLIDDFMLTVYIITTGIAYFSTNIVNYLEIIIYNLASQPSVTTPSLWHKDKTLLHLCRAHEDNKWCTTSYSEFKNIQKVPSLIMKQTDSVHHIEEEAMDKVMKKNVAEESIVVDDCDSVQKTRTIESKGNGDHDSLPHAITNALDNLKSASASGEYKNKSTKDFKSISTNNERLPSLIMKQRSSIDSEDETMNEEKECKQDVIIAENCDSEQRRGETVESDESDDQNSVSSVVMDEIEKSKSMTNINDREIGKSISNIISKLKLKINNNQRNRKNIKPTKMSKGVSTIIEISTRSSPQFIEQTIEKESSNHDEGTKWDQPCNEEDEPDEIPEYIISDNIDEFQKAHLEQQENSDNSALNLIDKKKYLNKNHSMRQFLNEPQTLDDEQEINFIPVECLLTTYEAKNVKPFSSAPSVQKRGRKATPKKQEVSVPKQIYCKYCDKPFDDLVVKNEHEATHTGDKPYLCKYCKQQFARREKKLAHERTHKDEKPFKCTFCGKLFTHKTNKVEHERTHTGERPYCCSFCDKTFAQLSNKTQHERIHTGKRPYKCNYCDKTFITSGDKKQHERIHTGEKPYSCTYCGKAFAHRKIQIHHERIHTGEKPYQCSYCEKAFIQPNQKTEHEKTHTGLRPFSCSFCGKSFTQKNDKIQHERIHTGERPYSCMYCGKSFAHKPKLVQHERIHTGERPYSCSYCEKTFNVRNHKTIHERIHTGVKPYSCTFCGKAFAKNSNRKQHEKIHTGEKPHSCSYCDKTFILRSQKIIHERTHTGEKPYSCSYCDKTFMIKNQKTKHESTHVRQEIF